MRTLATLMLFGAALIAAPRLDGLDPGTAAVVTLAVAVSLAGLAADGLTPSVVAFGALSGLAYTAVAPTAPELAGGVLLLGAHGARALRAPTHRGTLAHVAASLAAGAAAAYVAARHADGVPSVRAAAALVAGVLSALPLALPADDAVAHALASLARQTEGSARDALLRAATLRRRAMDDDGAIPEATARSSERAWASLIEAGRARASARGAGTTVLDQRILSHVEALEKLYAAAGERVARAAGLTDAATLADAKLEGETLAAEASALAEVQEKPAAESAAVT